MATDLRLDVTSTSDKKGLVEAAAAVDELANKVDKLGTQAKETAADDEVLAKATDSLGKQARQAMLGDRNRAANIVGDNRQPGQCVGGDFLVLCPDFSPGDLAIGVGIEPNGVIKVAQCDIPLSAHVLVPYRKREVAVARLVSMSGRHPQRQQKN